MSESKVHYPNFNVMHEEKHWDPHTREIVDNRLKTDSFYPFQFLTQQEANTLFQLCSLLLDDQRTSVISFVVHHFDSMLKENIGESQRKFGIPAQSLLIRDGLALLDQACNRLYGNSLDILEGKVKKQVANELMQGSFSLQSAQKNVPVNDFMDKVLSEAVSAYYSHPTVWSEIGYAGPAYPRGYVRSELGLTDPWEARKDGK